MGKFEDDLEALLEKLCKGSEKNVVRRLEDLRDRLVQLHKMNLVKINHSVMELVCAKYLLMSGYDVTVEKNLDGLSCDIYAIKGLGTLIVEIETGYVPPEHALDPVTYCRARIASKITRYSEYADKFGLASPPHYIMHIPQTLTKPPRYRSSEEIVEIKNLCDLYYRRPPVSFDEIRNARIHAVYILDVDSATVMETDPTDYVERVHLWNIANFKPIHEEGVEQH